MKLCEQNLRLARAQGAPGEADVAEGDARRLRSVLSRAFARMAEFRGRVDLIVTSPPYENREPKVNGSRGVFDTEAFRRLKADYLAQSDPRSLARLSGARYMTEMAGVYAECFAVLRPGGFIAVAVRDAWRRGRLMALPWQTITLCEQAGFHLYQHNVAVLAAVRGAELAPRASFWQLLHLRRARTQGEPLSLVAHEDVLIFRRPQ